MGRSGGGNSTVDSKELRGNGCGGNRRQTPTRADDRDNSILQRQDSAVTQKAGGEGSGQGGVAHNRPDREAIERINSNRVGTAGTVAT